MCSSEHRNRKKYKTAVQNHPQPGSAGLCHAVLQPWLRQLNLQADEPGEIREGFAEGREPLAFCYRSAEVAEDLAWLHALHLIFRSPAPASRRGSRRIMRSDTRCKVPALSNRHRHRRCHREAPWEMNLSPMCVQKDSEAVCCYFYADSLTRRLKESCWVTDHEKQFQLISVSDPY